MAKNPVSTSNHYILLWGFATHVRPNHERSMAGRQEVREDKAKLRTAAAEEFLRAAPDDRRKDVLSSELLPSLFGRKP